MEKEIIKVMKIDLSALKPFIDDGYIKQRYHPTKPLAIYNYTPNTQYEDHWTPETLVCRGLILDLDGNVVARPFDKFFNWGERGRKGSGHIVNVTEKMDGSLIIGYHYDNQWNYATRGAFDSEQAIWATEYMHNWQIDVDPDLTLMFECLYPENRIIVDYGKQERLVLLAARNRHTGEHLPYYPDLFNLAYKNKFPLVQTVHFNSITDILEATGKIDANQEGWVVEMSDGSRWKFKGDQYVELHKLISGLSYKTAALAVKEGKIHQYDDIIPDEFLEEWKSWTLEIHQCVRFVEKAVDVIFSIAPKATRKSFALWVSKTSPEYAPYLFAMYDDKDIRPLIFKKVYGV